MLAALLPALLAFEPLAAAAVDLASDYINTRSRGSENITQEDIDRLKGKKDKMGDALAALDTSLDDLADAIKDKIERDKAE